MAFVATLECLLKDYSCSIKLHSCYKDVKDGQLLSQRTTAVTIPRLCWILLTHKVNPSIDFKTSPFFVKLDANFFSMATNIQYGFYLMELSQSLCGYNITELNSPPNSFLQRPKRPPFLGSMLLVLCYHQGSDIRPYGLSVG